MNSLNTRPLNAVTAGSLVDGACARTADIPSQLDNLASAAERVLCAARHLEEKLRPIIRPAGPSVGVKVEGQVDPTVCEVAAIIRERVERLHVAAGLLESLSREVEL